MSPVMLFIFAYLRYLHTCAKMALVVFTDNKSNCGNSSAVVDLIKQIFLVYTGMIVISKADTAIHLSKSTYGYTLQLCFKHTIQFSME